MFLDHLEKFPWCYLTRSKRAGGGAGPGGGTSSARSGYPVVHGVGTRSPPAWAGRCWGGGEDPDRNRGPLKK